MTNFNFVNRKKAYGKKYFQFPRVLMYGSQYKSLSNDAKVAYMIFNDRFEYSLENDWADEHDRVYFIFTNEELKQLLNCSEHKVIKIKKELEEFNLLLQVQQGFNPKKKKNEPNRLYLADLEVEAQDVYKVEKNAEILDTSGTAKNAVRQKMNSNAETLDTSGTAENAVRQKNAGTLDISGTAKNAVNQYNIYKDIKDIKDQTDFQNQQIVNQFSENEKATEQELIEQYVEENELVSAYGQQTIQLVKNYSFNDLTQFKVYIDKFYYGWKSIEKEMDIKINPYEKAALHDELASTFKRVVIQFKQGKTKNINSYLYISLKNVFKDYAETQQENPTDLPPVPLDKWLG
ncbi:replication initiator protein A [Aerococcus urinaeequi]|uniref:replication initiator protein A n=1 Tax=Aerococcus urinaeequi TaxID=51665 RepID=UPI003D6AD741